MNKDGQRFKRILEEGVSAAHLRLRNFCEDFHADELLRELTEGSDDAFAVAAKALHWLCVEEGRFNRCTVGVKSVMVFLHEVSGSAPESHGDCLACLQELDRVLAGPECSIESIFAWIARWFTA